MAKTYAMDQIITIEGRNWRVVNIGYTDPDTGKTYYHLDCTGQRVRQKNGTRPRSIGCWLDAPAA